MTASPMGEVERVDLPQYTDERGRLTYVEENEHIPIDVPRVYYLYDVPTDRTRGGHAHIDLEQVVVAVHGSFELVLDDGVDTERYQLDDPSEGLYVPAGLWRDLEEFASETVCLVFASEPYDEDDYIREYEEYVEFAAARWGE